MIWFWQKVRGRDWSNAVSVILPDLDVFRIDAAAATPAETASWAHVGTILFGIWLAISLDAYQVWDGWVIAAIVLWAIGSGTGS